MQSRDIVQPIGWVDRRFTCVLNDWSPEIKEWFYSMPGAEVRSAGVVNVPWSMLPLVKGAVASWNVEEGEKWVPSLSIPAPDDPYDPSVLNEALLRVGVYPGLVGAVPTRLFSLAPFQRESIWRLWRLGGGLLHQTMGAGKTVQSLCWAALMGGPTLIVTKTSVTLPFKRAVRDHLQAEALDFPAPSHCPVRGGVQLTPEEVLFEYAMTTPLEKQFVIVGWGALRILKDYLLQYGFRTVIFDEAHMARATDRWSWDRPSGELVGTLGENLTSAAYALAERIPARLAMTGTPLFDRLKDLWGQLTLVEPRGWGMTAKRYLFRYCDARPGEYGGLQAKGVANNDELKARWPP